MLNKVLQWVAACLLDMIPSDRLYTPKLFNSLLRHGWYQAFEGVLLREGKHGTEIYLSVRGPKETFPGQWHVPGTLLYQTDSSNADQAERLGQREFKVKITDYRMVGTYYNRREGRGKCLHSVYLIKIDGEPKGGGKWFRVSDLPENIIHFHRDHVIPIALQAYSAQ